MPRSAILTAILLSSVRLLASEPAVAAPDPKVAARVHFEKGLAAFKDERFGEAADEFEEAYRLSPAFKVLFNIGQVNAALGRSAEAVGAFEKYLDQGGAAVPAERRKEVEAELERQRARVGTITVRTEPEGTEIRLDGKLVGRTPLSGPLRVTVGRHSIEALSSGFLPQLRELDVASRAELAIDLKLDSVAPRAIESDLRREAPPAAPSPSASASIPTPAPPPSEREDHVDELSAGRRLVGYVFAGAGLIATTTGVVIAITSANTANDAVDRLIAAGCGTAYDSAKCNPPLNDYNGAKSRNQLGWIVAAVGGVTLVSGVILVATAVERPAAVALSVVSPWATAQGGGVAINGLW